MSENVPPARSWKEVARELAEERNPSKCYELSQELNKALENEERKGTPIFARDQISNRNPS